MVEPRFEAHDANQLELKLSYLVTPGVKKQRYVVETFLFVSRTLGISGRSYGSRAFFEDTQTFLRLKTPSVPLAALAAARDEGARWFGAVERGLRADDRAPAAIDGLIRDFKLLGGIFRSAIRDEAHRVLAALEVKRMDPGARAVALDAARAFQVAMEQGLLRLRRLGEVRPRERMSPPIQEVWEAVDEYVAIYAEEMATQVVIALDALVTRSGDDGAGAVSALRERFADTALAAYRYRMDQGFPSFVVPGSTNEELPRRRRILKRLVSSALYLDLRTEEGGVVARDIIAGIAAAIAMLFAAFVTLHAQQRWGNVSAMFLVVLVLSYIVKDRLKDWGKRYIGKRAARWLPELVTHIRVPDSDQVIGVCRESAGVVDTARLPAEVLALRHANHPSLIATHGRPEVAIRYAKEVILDSHGLDRALPGVEGLNDIIRFNLARFRERMDRPIEHHRIVVPGTRQVLDVECDHVYHLNLILKVTRTGQGGREVGILSRVRIVLDADGLRRVEAFEGAAQPHGEGVALEGAALVRGNPFPGASDSEGRD